jgi:hypothetical protein
MSPTSVLSGGVADLAGRVPRDDTPRIVRLDDHGWFRVYGRPTGPASAWGLANAKALLAKIEGEIASAKVKTAPASPTVATSAVEIASRWFAVAKRLQRELECARAEVAEMRAAGCIPKDYLDAMRKTERATALQAFRDQLDPKALRAGVTPEDLEPCTECGLLTDTLRIARGGKICPDCAKGGR